MEIMEKTQKELQEMVWCYDCTKEQWEAFIFMMKERNVLEIDEEMFLYWLEVLPPVYMDEVHEIKMNNGEVFDVRCSFGFCEGFDYIVDFWRHGKSFFCKKSNRKRGENERY